MLNDYSGSRSHRNGLLLALGEDEKYDQKLNKEEYQRLESESISILKELRSRFPHLSSQADFFTMETCLCSFKKIFRERHGRYLGYYLDRQSEEILQAENDGWFGIEWEVLWQSRNECLDKRMSSKNLIDKEKFSIYIQTGKIERMDWVFDDAPKVKIGLEALW
jgi:hypothetical protein